MFFGCHAVSALADGREHDRGRALVELHRVLTLEEVLRHNEQVLLGRIIELELERKRRNFHHKIKHLRPDGRMSKIVIDAETGALIESKWGGAMRILLVEDEKSALPIDQRDLEEILCNRLDNARKWAKGRVVVTVVGSPDVHRIDVDDDGPRIPVDRLEDVLAGGFRLDRTVPGIGIGLAIASDLAPLHGGRIAIGPSALGGTRVSLLIDDKPAD